MNSAELAAYIGAAAWIPQIGTWLYGWLTRPVLSIVTHSRPEIGFTSYGPIFNLRMAFSADRKDLILDDFQLELVHQDGDRRTLRWQGIQENLGETRDAAGVKQGELMKEQLPIALKIGTVSLVEKLVRFQEPKYEETTVPLMQALVAHFSYLKRTDPENYVAKTLKSKELLALVDAREKRFWWKPGRYDVTMKPSSPKKFTFPSPRFSFELSAIDADRVKQNVDQIKKDLENTINSNLDDFKLIPIVWNWAYPPIDKSSA